MINNPPLDAVSDEPFLRSDGHASDKPSSQVAADAGHSIVDSDFSNSMSELVKNSEFVGKVHCVKTANEDGIYQDNDDDAIAVPLEPISAAASKLATLGKNHSCGTRETEFRK